MNVRGRGFPLESKSSPRPGFTLIELIVVVAVCTGLVLCCIPARTHTTERMHRLMCQSNLRQMGQGSQMYAQDDSQGRLTGSLGIGGQQVQSDDDLNWLHGFGAGFPPGYIQDLNRFVCPSTRNFIRTNVFTTTTVNGLLITRLTDLVNNAVANTATAGHSYEVFGAWNGSSFPRKTLRTVVGYQHVRTPLAGVVSGPNQTFLIVDAMDISALQPTYPDNTPSPSFGHGADGANVVFADAHVEWIGTQDWNYRYELSQDSGRQLNPY